MPHARVTIKLVRANGFAANLRSNAIGISLSSKHQAKSVNKGVHLALAEHIDDVISESIEVEEHPDYIKDETGHRGDEINANALMHRFYGVVIIDEKPYRVMTLMREEKNPIVGNGIHAYEVQKIEVLDEETPNTSNGVGSHPQSEIGSSYPLAKLLKGVEKSYDSGIKILNESKNIDARADLRGGKKNNKDIISSHSEEEPEKMSRGNAGEDTDGKEDTARYRTVSELAGEIDPTVTLENYHEYTDATFDAVKTVDHSDDSRHPYEKKMLVKAEWEDMKASHPDWEWHRSPKDGSRSEYLIDRENGDVYRYSDHWGVVATSNWKLNGSDVRYETAIGKANISDFRRNNVTAYKYAKAEKMMRAQRAELYPAMRAEAERLGMKFNVRINVIEDVDSITHKIPYIQERRRRSKGWYDTATGQVYIVLPNNRDVEDVRATVFHETVGHKGLRELIGERGYGDFLREVYEHADRDVRRRIDSLAEKRRWNLDKATDEYLSVLAERDFKDFDDAERSVWQWLKDKVLKAIDMFLGSLRLPEWVRLSDNELRYILWRSKERLERGKESPMDTARDVVRRRELGIDNGLYSMGYSDMLLRFNDNIMHPVASENDDKLAVTSLPSDAEIPVTEITGYDVSVAEAVHAIDGLPNKVMTFDGVRLNISRATRNKLKNEISKHKNDVDVLSAFSQLENVVSKSILIEEHRDRIKVNGERNADNPSDTNIEKTQRFYGAVSVNGVIYRVKTTAIVSKESSNSRMHNYEVTKIELLPSIASTRQNAYTAAGNNSITLAKLLKDVEFSYEKGKKLLDEIDNGTSIGLNAADSVALDNDILERDREEYEDGDEIGVYESGGRWRAEGFAFSRPTKEQLLDAVRSLYGDYAVSLSEDGRSFVMERIRYGGRRSYTKKQIDARKDRWMRQMRHAVESLLDQMGIGDLVTVVEDSDGLIGRRANAKGWYDVKTGKIVIVLGNHANSSDVVMTIMHEVVGHYGLRRMFGEHFDAFLDNVYKSVTPEIRRDMDRLAERYGARLESESPGSVRSDESLRRLATEEYLAKLAEDTDYNRRGFHELMITVRSLFLKMLHRIGLRGFDYDGLGENELRYLLWRSYENIVHPNEYRSILGEARDIVMCRSLKVDSSVAPASRGLVADAKSKHPEATFLERSGNGYAVRGEDAVKVAKVLGVSVGIEYGEPVVHIDATELDDVLPKLLKSGMRVAVVDAVGKVGESTVVYGETLDDVNRRFNDELERYEKGEIPVGTRFELGMPSKELESAGFPYLPISMRASLLSKKAGMERHPFAASDLRDFVKALQKPIAIFKYSKENMRNLIIDVSHGDKHFLVGVTLDYKAGDIEVNSVSGLFPKESHEWIKWILDGKAIRIDRKRKVLDLIDSLRTNPAESVRIGLNLSAVAKLTEDFENPKLSGEKNQRVLFSVTVKTPGRSMTVRCASRHFR